MLLLLGNPPLGLSPNATPVQWNDVATGVLFHCWGCQLNECMISSLKDYAMNTVIATGVLFHCLACELNRMHGNACVHYHVTLKSQNVSRTVSMAHLNISGTFYRLLFGRQTHGFEVYRVLHRHRKQIITPICMPCIVCTFLSVFRVLATASHQYALCSIYYCGLRFPESWWQSGLSWCSWRSLYRSWN